MYDVEDERGVPVSAGIPPTVIWAGVAGVLLIFVIAALVLGTSEHGHQWPWDKALQIKL